MPPAVSDDDSDMDIPDDVPARPVKGNPKAEEEEDDDEEDDDEFQVEKILSHKINRGKVVYRVKWLGYENEEDETWEPVDNLENAMEAVEAYHKSIGGTPVPSGKGQGKRSASNANIADSPAGAKKRGRNSDPNGTAKENPLPVGSWEDACQVAAIIEEHDMPDASSTIKLKNDESLVGLLQWNDGRKTQHPMATLRNKCPQRLLDYYESHLVFKGDPRYVDGEDDD